jgi:hypothetical protein
MASPLEHLHGPDPAHRPLTTAESPRRPSTVARRFLAFDEIHFDVLACTMADRLTVRRDSRMNYFGATVFLQLSGIIDGRAKRRRYDLHPHPGSRTGEFPDLE